MVGKACSNRLQKEYRALQKDPRPNVEAHPSPTNILEWQYVVTGPAGSDYEGGVYHGKVIFSADYPFKAPNVVMCTPSGRFEPNAKICMSMTAFHPESWNPSWTVGTILTGLLSFLLEDAPTTGSVKSTSEQKRQLAAQSLEYNCRNATFRKVFPLWVEEQQRRQQAPQEQRIDGRAAAPAAVQPPSADVAWRAGVLIVAAAVTILAIIVTILAQGGHRI